MTSVTQDVPTIEIKGATYTVEAIAPGECGASAVRVTKLASGESYDVLRTRENVVECSCPDFVCRHEGRGTVCKHGAAMVARGFLPAAPIASKPSVRPITRKDQVAARTWGLKLPADAPMAVEAPAKVEPTPEFIAEPLPVEVDDEDPPEGVDLSPFAPSFTVIDDQVEVAPPATVDLHERPRPTRLPRFEPTPEMDMERLGLRAGQRRRERQGAGGAELRRAGQLLQRVPPGQGGPRG